MNSPHGIPSRLGLLAFLVFLGGVAPARADVMLITSRSAVNADDFIDWEAALGPAGTAAGSPTPVLSNGGVTASISVPGGGAFLRRDQIPPASVGGWDGNFAPGDALLTNFVIGNGEIIIDFGATGLAAAGAQIQPDSDTGPFTARIEAFDEGGASLGVFFLNGFSAFTADNTAIFIGVKSDSANIHSISFSVPDQSGGVEGSFAINRFDFTTQVVPEGIPEPATLALFGLGLAGLVGYRLRRRA